MKKRKQASAEPAPLLSPSSAGQSPLRQGSAGQVELEGPSDSILTPPPKRRTGVLVAATLAVVALAGIVSLAIVKPDLFVTAVEAFVGGI
jgi:hypothetical protein